MIRQITIDLANTHDLTPDGSIDGPGLCLEQAGLFPPGLIVTISSHNFNGAGFAASETVHVDGNRPTATLPPAKRLTMISRLVVPGGLVGGWKSCGRLSL